VALVLITERPAAKIKSFIIEDTDSFNAHMLVTALVTVLTMSVALTVIGTWIGERRVSMEPITYFFYKWPRNFAIAFIVEAFFAQPIARTVMKKFHARKATGRARS
jgi:hypothetical protein